MKRWGVLVTIFYLLILLLLGGPGVLVLSGLEVDWGFLKQGTVWVWVGLLISGGGLLLFVSVDTLHKRLKPRQHVWVSVATAIFFIALLTLAAWVSLLAGIYGDGGIAESKLYAQYDVFAATMFFWCLWSVLFWYCLKSTSRQPNRLRKLLLRGSVLELLIAVPAHIVTRQRDDCSAPMVTGYGIATGIAIMLMCFGPSVIMLYQEKLKTKKRK